MMDNVTATLVQTAFQAITLTVAFISGVQIWRQLLAMKAASEATVSERLASQSFDNLRHIAEQPELYPYFYEQKELADTDPGRVQILCLAEVVAIYLEHIVLQRRNLPPSSSDAWMRYVYDHYNSSKVVRHFIAGHRDWFAPAFLRFLETVKPHYNTR